MIFGLQYYFELNFEKRSYLKLCAKQLFCWRFLFLVDDRPFRQFEIKFHSNTLRH